MTDLRDMQLLAALARHAGCLFVWQRDDDPVLPARPGCGSRLTTAVHAAVPGNNPGACSDFQQRGFYPAQHAGKPWAPVQTLTGPVLAASAAARIPRLLFRDVAFSHNHHGHDGSPADVTGKFDRISRKDNKRGETGAVPAAR